MSPNPRYPTGELKPSTRIDQESRQGLLQQIVKHNKEHREAPLDIGNPTASTFKELTRIEMKNEGRNKYPIIPPWEEIEEENICREIIKKALALKESATADRRPHSALDIKAQPAAKKEDQTKRQSIQNPSQAARNSRGERTSAAPRAVYAAMWAKQRASTLTKSTQKGKEIKPPPKLKTTESASTPRLPAPALAQKHDVKVADSKMQRPAAPQPPARAAAKSVEARQDPNPILHTNQADAPSKQKGVAFASTAETNTGSLKPTKSTPKRTPTLPATPKPDVATTKAKDAKDKEREEEDEIIRKYNEIKKRRQREEEIDREKQREIEHRKRDQELELTKQKQKVRAPTSHQQQNPNQTDVDKIIQDLQIRAAAIAPLSPTFRMRLGQRDYGINMTPERVRWAREYLECFDRVGRVARRQLGGIARVVFPFPTGNGGGGEFRGVNGRRNGVEGDHTGLLDTVIRSLPPED